MYDIHVSGRGSARRSAAVSVMVWAFAVALGAFGAGSISAQMPQFTDPNSVIRKISGASEQMELTTNTSRILTLDKNIPRVQVNNPELIAVTPLSATQVQISAKKAGVTQVNLWDEDGNIHTLDVQIYGDARELQAALATQFPHTSVKVFRYSESLVLTGFVDRPDHISSIMSLAQDYAPKVINNINVGGVQQVLLKTKVMEISRTKLRRLSTDFSWLNSNGSYFSTGVSGLLNQTTNLATGGFQTLTDTSGKAAEFGIVGDNAAFFGFIDWLEQHRAVKILAEPNLVAVSGRPAQFNVGGEIPIIVPQSLGTASIEFKPFGTQIDFLPIVLGNGNIRLEVRPRISDVDETRSVIVQNFVIPGLTVRQVDTAVEMKAGQTFALAGLVQERSDTVKRGLPYVQDIPVVGVPFRKMENEVEEIELLILVTPEFIDPIDACEVPYGGPGTFTTQPTNHGLYCGGQMEVPTHCNPAQGLASSFGDNCGCNSGCNTGGGVITDGGPTPIMQGGTVLPGGTGYDDSSGTPMLVPSPATYLPQPSAPPAANPPAQPTPATPPQSGAQNTFDDLSLPVVETEQVETPLPAATAPAAIPPQRPAAGDQSNYPTALPPNPFTKAAAPGAPPTATAPRPYSPQRRPVFMRNATRPYNPQMQRPAQAQQPSENGLIGPVGYDVE
jgi:pilus assembly protein CpaC